jgi:3-dehydroquinate synthase
MLFKQPIKIQGLKPEDVYEVTKLDKKMDSDKIKFILLQQMGNAIIDPTVTREEIIYAVQSIME